MTKMEATAAGRSSPVELLLVVLSLGFAALGLLPLGDPDVWWHLRTGELVLESGFTKSDPWSYASERPWLLHEWLAEVVMYLSYLIGGYHGVIVLHALMLGLLAALILRSCRREAGPVGAFVVGFLTLVAIFPGGSTRPQLVSFALLAVILPRLRTAVEAGRAPWELIPVIWLWANLHAMWPVALFIYGALVVGFLVDGGRAAWRSARSMVLVGALATLTVTVTPGGPGLLLLPFQARDAPRFITEFNPPALHSPFTLCAYTMVVIVVVGWARQREHVPATEIAFVLSAAFVGLSYARTVPILAIAMAPLAARSLHRWSKSPPPSRMVWNPVNAVIAVGLGLAFLVAAALWLPHVPGVKVGAPYAASRTLDALPGRAKVINEYELGGWMLWTARDSSPGIDGRSEVYPLTYLEQYLATLKLEGDWQRFIEDSGADAAWLRKESPLVDGLQWLGWRTIDEDDFTFILVPPENSPTRE